MNTDPISNMLTSINNAVLVKKASVIVPYSQLKHAIADKLRTTGMVGSVEKKEQNERAVLEIGLLYDANGISRLNRLTRVSKPGRRMYSGATTIRPFRDGQGFTLLTTPKGVLTNDEARKEKVGGELLLTAW